MAVTPCPVGYCASVRAAATAAAGDSLFPIGGTVKLSRGRQDGKAALMQRGGIHSKPLFIQEVC